MNNARRLIHAWLAWCALVFCTGTALWCEERPPIKIGVISSLDPIGALWSNSANAGFEKAAAEINAAGGIGGRNLILLFEDDRFEPKNALAAYHKFTAIERADLLLGPQFEQTLTPVAVLAQREQRLLITTIASTPASTARQPFIVHSVPPDKLVAKCLAGAIVADKHKEVAFVLPEESYSQTLGRFIKQNLPSGVKTEFINYLPATDDYKPLLLNLKKLRVSAAVFFFVTAEAAITVFAKMHELDIKLPIYSNEVLHGSQEFLAKAGTLAEGTTYCIVPFDETAAPYRDFFNGLPQKPALPLYSLIAYDTLQWLAALMASHGTDNRKLRDALYQLDYQGHFTRYRFDEYGDLLFDNFKPYVVSRDGYRQRE